MHKLKKIFFKDHRTQTWAEEIANAISHGFGILFGITALVILLIYTILQGSYGKIIGVSLFSTTLVLMYAASTLYHAVKKPQLKRALKILDHVSIYLLIAGTYTPFAIVALQQQWKWILLSSIWLLAALGILFKLYFIGKLEKTSTVIYLAMGWLGVTVVHPLYLALPFPGLVWLASGGLCYTVGVIFYIWKRLRFSHTVWHIFVLGGSTCHFFATLLYIVPSS